MATPAAPLGHGSEWPRCDVSRSTAGLEARSATGTPTLSRVRRACTLARGILVRARIARVAEVASSIPDDTPDAEVLRSAPFRAHLLERLRFDPEKRGRLARVEDLGWRWCRFRRRGRGRGVAGSGALESEEFGQADLDERVAGVARIPGAVWLGHGGIVRAEAPSPRDERSQRVGRSALHARRVGTGAAVTMRARRLRAGVVRTGGSSQPTTCRASRKD